MRDIYTQARTGKKTPGGVSVGGKRADVDQALSG